MKGYFKSTAGEIAAITGGTLTAGKGGAVIETVTTDSREMDKNNLFIPLAGEKSDGHNFLDDLIRDKKINCALTEKSGFEKAAGENGVSLIQCTNTLYALGKIAGFHRDSMSPLMVGITGTNGKTTTKELVHAVLSSKYKTHRNHKNYNNEIGVPFTLLALNSTHEAAVIEMGMNHKGEIERLSKMVKPDIGIITSIGAGHLEFLESVEGVAYAKSEIIKGMGKGSTLVLNRETECFHIVSALCEEAGIKLITFGMNSDADIYPESYTPGINSLEVVYKGTKITAPLYGRHNAFNLMAAIAFGEIAGISPQEYASALAGFKNVSGRSDVIDKGYYIIDDTYNSNPLSSLFAVDSVCEVFPQNRKIAVLSDMKELGELSGLYHVKIGEITASRKFDVIVLYGEMAHYYMKGALNIGFPEDKIFVFDDKEGIAPFLKGMLQQGDVVLVKGSRSMKMEDVVNSLQG